MWKSIGLAALAFSQVAWTADNQLTSEEKSAGWRLLFDGRTYAGWQDPAKRTPPGDSFVIENGCLKAVPHAKILEDLFTSDTFGDFELQFDWKISKAGNSGVKYRIQDHLFIPDGTGKFEDRVKAALLAPRAPRPGKGQDYVIGFEYQITDNATNPDAVAHGPKHRTAALYDVCLLYTSRSRPLSEW